MLSAKKAVYTQLLQCKAPSLLLQTDLSKIWEDSPPSHPPPLITYLGFLLLQISSVAEEICHLKFSHAKFKVAYLGQGNPKHKERLGREGVERSPEGFGGWEVQHDPAMCTGSPETRGVTGFIRSAWVAGVIFSYCSSKIKKVLFCDKQLPSCSGNKGLEICNAGTPKASSTSAQHNESFTQEITFQYTNPVFKGLYTLVD